MEVQINFGFDNNIEAKDSGAIGSGTRRLAFVGDVLSEYSENFKTNVISAGLHLFVSAVGGTGKTNWARKSKHLTLKIIHFMEPDAISRSSEMRSEEVIALTVNDVCEYVEIAWKEGKVPFINSLSVSQFSQYPGFSTAEGGYSLGFTSMLTQLAHELTERKLPLIVVLNARRESDSDPKFSRALADLESSSSTVVWFKANQMIVVKTRLDEVKIGSIAVQHSRRSWVHVNESYVPDGEEVITSPFVNKVWRVNESD